jgi:hypothetical protein
VVAKYPERQRYMMLDLLYELRSPTTALVTMSKPTLRTASPNPWLYIIEKLGKPLNPVRDRLAYESLQGYSHTTANPQTHAVLCPSSSFPSKAMRAKISLSRMSRLI